MISFYRFFFLVISAFLLSGCTATLTPEQSAPSIDDNNLLRTVALAVLDHRPYVVNGDKKPSFEGLIRTSLGIPISFYTDTKEDMSVFLSTRIKVGLNKKDIDVIDVFTQPSDSQEAVITKLIDTQEISLFIELYQWKYDHWTMSDNSYYDILVQLRNEHGELLYSKKHEGENDIPNGISGTIPNEMQLIYKKRFEQIFNSIDFKEAIIKLSANTIN